MFALQLPLEGGRVNDMGQTQPKVVLPAWVFPTLVGLLLAILSNVYASGRWSAQVSANQTYLAEQVTQMRLEIKALAEENRSLRIELTELKTAAKAQRR